MRALALLLGAVLACPALAAGEAAPEAGTGDVRPLGFQSHLEPQAVHLGEPFTYVMSITHAPGQRFELKTPTDPGAFEVLEVARSREDGKGQATTTFRVKMSMFELGKQRLPDFTFDVFEEGKTRRFVAPGLEVEGLSSLPPDASQKGEALYDIKGPEDVPIRSWRLLYALAALLALAAAGYGLYRFLKRPRVRGAPVEPPRPLDVRALAALEALRQEDLPGQGRGREFFFRLSEVLRGYLGERYTFEALECTSAELLEALRRLHTPGLSQGEMRTFVESSDWVKFAKLEPSLDQCKEALDFGFRLVRETTVALAPVPAVPPPAPHAPGPDVQ